MFPKSEHCPSAIVKDLVGLDVTGTIHGYLVGPVRGVGRGCGVMLGTAVPVASVDEDCDSGRREDKVSRTANVLLGPSIDPVTEALGVQQPAHGQFRRGVPPSVPLH